MNKAAWRGLFFVVLASLALVALVGGAGFLALKKLAPVLTPPAPPARRTAESEAAKPITIPANAHTEAEFNREVVAWWHDHQDAAYWKMGVKNPTWDKQAIALMELCARAYKPTSDTPTKAQLLQATQPLLKAGCSDPYVLDCIGWVLAFAGQRHESIPYRRRALEGYAKISYPKALIWSTPGNVAHLLAKYQGKSAEAEVERLTLMEFHWLAEASHTLAGQEGRLIGAGEDQLLADVPLELQAQLYGILQADPQADPWITSLVGGRYHLAAALKLLSAGPWSGLAEDQRESYRSHLNQARACLEKAYALHPDFPEAPALMITVSLYDGSDPAEERVWFDRAVAAEADYPSAYFNYMSCLLTRNGGSHRAIYRFGLTCADTKRYDTDVPGFLHLALFHIDYYEHDPGIWRRPGVYDKLKEVYEGRLPQVRDPRLAADLKSEQAAVAWRSGHFEDAKRLFDELGGNVDEFPFKEWLHTTSKAVRQEVSRPAKPPS